MELDYLTSPLASSQVEERLSPPFSDSASVQKIMQSPSWYQALTLPERLATLRAPSARQATRAAGNAELAERRLRKWKAQPPFELASLFAERLALEEATEAELRLLLGEPMEALQARIAEPPDWLRTLTEAFATFDSPQPLGVAPGGHQLAELLDPITPLLKQGVARLQAGVATLIHQHPAPPFDKGTIGPLVFAPVLDRLLSALIKPLTLELHIARLQHRLQGETPEERFQAFVKRLCEPGAMLELLHHYPVLARLLVSIIDQGVAYGLELLGHLCADWQEICERLAPGHAADTAVAVQVGAGDSHRHGRSVVLFTFRSGFKLLYKPKALAIDRHFQELLAWLNERGAQPALRAVRVLDRGSYGWSEYVQGTGCTSQAEVERFYVRMGGYLALLYAIEGTDFHYENLIACGEYPMLVDLETLFQPSLALRTDNTKLDIPQSLHALRASVLRLGLLPQRVWATAGGDGVDISGLGGKDGQLTPHPVATLEAVGTDQMRMVRQRLPMQGQHNQPTLQGAPVDILEYREQVSAGFTQIYRLLMTHREALLSDILPLFAQDQIRIVLRPTNSYARLLQESLHPTLLRNALDRDRFLDHLWVPVPKRQYLSKIIRAEVDDLSEDNIPIFTTQPASRTLFTSRGEGLVDFFDASGLATVEQRMRNLDEHDLARQLWVIQASFATKLSGEGQATWKAPQLLPPHRALRPHRLLRAARAVGDRLCALAVCSEQEVSWLTLQLAREREWALSITSLDLYSGTAGIGLFLAYLGALTSEPRYTVLARRVVEAIHQQLALAADDVLAPGAFSGWGGLLYLLAHLGALWQDAALFTRAQDLIERWAGTIETDQFFDVLGGVAGGIRGLLALYRVAPSPRTLDVALRCGEHLLAHAKTMPNGVGWTTPLGPTEPLTGYSHGAAGIALSLFELAAVSGAARFKETALAALAYERSLFSPERQNWPDLRDEQAGGSPENGYMVTWCHGAPGIALSRLGSLAYHDDAATRQEIAVALQTTLAQGFGLNHSLCHGDLGNLDVLLVASQVLPDAPYRAEEARLASMLLESIDRQGWLTGVPLGIETPGLLTGIAGIGYELLRLAAPDEVPSVLLLAPPHLAQ